MVELLTVIAIMSLLIALSLTAYRNYIQSARDKATRATISKISGLLDDRLRAVDIAFEPNRQNRFKADVAIMMGDPPVMSEDLARIIVRKNKLKQFFPQRFSELTTNYGDTNYADRITELGLTVPSGGPSDPTESAEVLYFMLRFADVLGMPPVGEDAFGSGEFADTDGDGWLEFVDSWGRPLRFYRWPTRFIRDGGADDPIDDLDLARIHLLFPDVQRELLVRDPHDPLGDFAALPSVDELDYHTKSTYHALLVVSAGEDGQLGLYEPGDETNFGILAQPLADVLADPLNSVLNDNLTNQQKSGGN